MENLIGSGRKLLALAVRAGAKEAEVFGTIGRSISMDLRKSEIELGSESFFKGLGLRAVVKGAVGFSSTSDLSRLEDVAQSAVRSARARGRDDEWKALPDPAQIRMPENTFDPALDRLRPEECIDLAMGMLRGCAGIRGAEPSSGGIGCVSSTEFVLNTSGVELKESGTLMHGSLETIAKGGDADVASGNEFQNSRSLISDFELVGRNAAEMAVSSLNGTKIESGTFDVILRPIAFTELLEYTLIPSISGDSVLKGRSTLAGKIGQTIASEDLIVTDDGLLRGGMGSSAFDGEGVPSRRSSIIEQGILKAYIYDSYTAGRAGTTSTGNAVRSGFSDVPRIGIRNLIVGSEKSFDLDSDTKGLLVNGLIGAHTANPISGDFSVEARNSFYVNPDEKPRPVRSMMLAGNIFDLLKGIEIGRDVRAVGAVVTPSVRVRMKVVGS